MSEMLLQSLDVTNFRSVRGHIHAPLDAKVVLVHGENGAGKTSLLSAIELALTGGVQSLQRADPAYARQLLHRAATSGSVVLKTKLPTSEQSYAAKLTTDGAQSTSALADPLSAFFRERAFLPQSLLGQLLQIYQESGNDANSPLARFVGDLLGLDRLDALEAGLKPLLDIRNVRKTVDGWLAAENEKSRRERMISDQGKARKLADEQIHASLTELTAFCTALELAITVREDNLDDVAAALDDQTDSDAFATIADQQRRLGAILRETEAARQTPQGEPLPQAAEVEDASKNFAAWEAEHGPRIQALRGRVDTALPDGAFPSNPERFFTEALVRLRAERKQVQERVTKARADADRYVKAQDERIVAEGQRDTIDQEIERSPASAGSLASALAELTTFISDDVCPVCERDFSETGEESLSDHVHARIRSLSTSAERLLTLGRSRSDVQVSIERLDREIETLSARVLGAEALAELDRRAALLNTLVADVDSLGETLRAGGRLQAADVAARRVVTAAQTRDVTLAAARETLSVFAISIAAPALADGEAFEAAGARLNEALAAKAKVLEQRLSSRRRAKDQIATIRAAIVRRNDVDAAITKDTSAWSSAEAALQRAQRLRDQGNAIRGTVDQVRSSIIRREFNDRLNKLWRDLFVRLAPGEPFVPAFRIPQDGTQRLQPKLITEHRDGGEAGGTPGAMLSAGNLNTAALTLFVALHLSVRKQLPWLILDDPVQSMDDVHIAHFAALLRTLSKEHGRQILIAVHDRQLFEYLKLELSPAFPDDSLLTLELSRGPRRDSICVPKRFSFKEETVLLAA